MEDGHPPGLTAYAMKKIGAGFGLPRPPFRYESEPARRRAFHVPADINRPPLQH